MEKDISIREVARRAGVSASTVSRVMNGTAKVDESKKEKILKVIEELNYRPNELARALYYRSSKIIGIIIPDIKNPFFAELASAIEEEAYRNGYKPLLCNSYNNIEKERMSIHMLQQMKADGIIISTIGENQEVIFDTGIPVVVMDRKISDEGELAYVESDNYKGGVLATEHLLECGCRKIVCVRGNMEVSSFSQRYQGYKDVCAEHGIDENIIDCGCEYEDGLEIGARMIEMYPDVDGVVAVNDLVALGICRVANEKGMRIPADIKIVGYDDITFCNYCFPGMTSIRQPIAEMGYLAVRLIMNHEKGLPVQQKNVLDVRLMRRGTT